MATGFPVILLVDDDVVIRNLLLQVLHRESYAVLVAADGLEAIELSRIFDGEIDLLLTDMEMPHMGGDQLADLIMRQHPGIRVLQISGRLAQSFLGRNLSFAFLQKPFTPLLFVEKLREVMIAPPTVRLSKPKTGA